MKLVVITSRMPSPLDTGDRLRIYNQIKYLSEKYEIYLFFITEGKPSLEELQKLESIVTKTQYFILPKWKRYLSVFLNAILGKMPFQVAYFYHSEVKVEFEKFVEKIQPSKIYYQLARTATYLIEKENSILDLMDAFSYGATLNAEYSKSFVKKIFWRMESRKMKRFERKISEKFENLTIISSKEKSRLPHIFQHMTVVTNGVNIPKSINRNEKYDIGFVGNMSYPPNLEAFLYIRNQILGLYTDKYEERLKFLVAGKDSEMMKNGIGITLGGWYNNINVAYQSLKIFVAPMYMGMGQQNKILEAIANYTPVICSERIAQALELRNDEHLIIADSPIEYCEAINSVLQGDYSEMTTRAYEYICKNYTWENTTLGLMKIIEN